ncbi:iron-sulfur cluster assembly accessory protein [Rhizobium azibense]|uniref:Iron-sulfur cluster assembly accessory protein n=1 Tax=Rhizobium azibense TaxID=1136135 RepID=A0A4R3RBN9_9HYPH|nr:iron-sulfur cluster assembly accessory protein [Rhizobium azibense]TCU32840.1 iron-sulfur cluster assembly accessory protein [Rhizobium azibense]
MITLTENAVAVMNAALSRTAEPVQGFRIMVEAGGCAGFKYLVGLESFPREGDAVIETDGVKVFVDVGSQPHVAGMTIDFVTNLESSGFVFDNPNAGEKCACGKSFG